LYYLSQPFGFHRVAFLVLAAFANYLCVFFFNRFEVPAVLSNRINENVPRANAGRLRNVLVQLVQVALVDTQQTGPAATPAPAPVPPPTAGTTPGPVHVPRATTAAPAIVHEHQD